MKGKSLDDSDEYFAPHCDQSILHAPSVCEYCDLYPKRQRDRERQRINFTNEHDPHKAPCPSTHFRPDEMRDLWPGNTPEGYL